MGSGREVTFVVIAATDLRSYRTFWHQRQKKDPSTKSARHRHPTPKPSSFTRHLFQSTHLTRNATAVNFRPQLRPAKKMNNPDLSQRRRDDGDALKLPPTYTHRGLTSC
ncbi:hypothetical protein EVAR_95877_1 [Eumeta japonica]|uniref:Uncharacterized protein n=1 Tax=Eumeta variegata TaxID=151549 RepID=A0A4C1VNS7_EUMVA|nr:hypothetical protein EVAR_95877_1 [Eumeta japonica]